MTWLELAKKVGREFDYEWSDDDADYVLWEYTGFPEFWHTDNPMEECRQQIREHLNGV